MENKKHYKLYKKGKQWCVAAITLMAVVTTTMVINDQAVHAADTSAATPVIQTTTGSNQLQNNQQQFNVNQSPTIKMTTAAQSVPSEASQSQLIDDRSDGVASYDQQGQLQVYTEHSVVHQTNDVDQQSNIDIAANDISTIKLNGDLSGISKENLKTVSAQLNLNTGEIINAWGTLKYQGDISVGWPKKGYRLKLYRDANLTKKLKIVLPGAGFKTNAFNLKANFTDPTEGNNIVNAEIFKEITASRSGLSQSIVNKMPNYGQIVGIPVALNINGTYQGLYTLNTYHQDKLFDTSDEKQTDLAITGAGYDPITGFQEPVTLNHFISDSGFDNISPAQVTQATVNHFNQLYQLANATDNYTQLEQQYLDIPSAIDYIAFSMAVSNQDGARKNIFYVSKDNGKWSLVPYDLDWSWGNSWDGTKFNLNFNYMNFLLNSGNRLLINIYNHHRQDIINRYRELRTNVLSTGNVIRLFNHWMDSVGTTNYRNNDRIWNYFNMAGRDTHRPFINRATVFRDINQRLKNVDQQLGIITPDETITIPETLKITRKIELNQPGQQTRLVNQVVTFTRTGIFNTATNNLILDGDWQSSNPTFAAYQISQIAGMVSRVNGQNLQQLAAATVSPSTPCTIFQVNYLTPVQANVNLGWLDSHHLSSGTLQVSGWHIARNVERPYHFIIVVDSVTHRELGRVRVDTPVSRPDVRNAYRVAGAEDAGFNANVHLNLSYLSNVNDSLAIVSRYSDAPNGEGNNTDYWFPVFKLDQRNDAYLDSFKISQNGIQAQGWHVTNAAINHPYHFIILYDQTLGREISRQRVLNGVRADVHAVYPDINNAALSGFSTSFSLNNVNLTHQLRIISRYSNSSNGEGNYIDYWFAPQRLLPVAQRNVAYLDSFNLSSGEVHASGWHATDNTQIEDNHYLILFDNTTNTQVASQRINNVARPDVANAYPGIPNAGNAGFNVNFGKLNLIGGHTYSLVSRYSTSDQGNGDGGYYTDYWFKPIALKQQDYSIDQLGIAKDGLHVNGWMASDYSASSPFAYLLVMVNGREVTRQRVQLNTRSDVAAVYPSLYNSQNSGFSTVIPLTDQQRRQLTGQHFQILLRFSGDEAGNLNYADQWSQYYVM